MKTLLFDTETNGLLDQTTKMHCLVIKDVSGGEIMRFNDQALAVLRVPANGSIEDGLRLLLSADAIVAHNAISFDLPVIKKLYPWWNFTGEVIDTLVLSRLIWTNLKDRDFAFQRKNRMYPAYLIGTHKLEAWGWRLGEHKGEYTLGWEAWNVEMEDYCAQDVVVLGKLFATIQSKNYSAEAMTLEHDCAYILHEQVMRGVAVNERDLMSLISTLQGRRAELEGELRGAYEPWYVRDGGREFIPKRDNAKSGYTEGAPLCKVKQVVFNPSSRDHIASRLMRIHGWEPTEFTETGKPKVDEEILGEMNFPQAAKFTEYLTVDKRLGQMAEGKEAWIKHIRNGRIHGGITGNGAVTGRATHHHPNIAQTPKVGSLYGEESRACFIPGIGYVLVGADLAGLELRCLAHFMARYDGGAYAKIVVEGSAANGTDVHSVNCRALGFDPKELYVVSGKQVKGRDIAKTFIYAWMYGAGDEKIGRIVGKGRAEGKRLKALFLSNLPALGALIKAVKERAKSGSLRGLDGRILHIRHQHASLNTLLQSAGALIAKKAMVLAHQKFRLMSIPVHQVLWIHDEFQFEAPPELAEITGNILVESMQLAGAHFNFRAPITGEAKSGKNWAKTH
jgi:hypothetical protein